MCAILDRTCGKPMHRAIARTAMANPRSGRLYSGHEKSPYSRCFCSRSRCRLRQQGPTGASAAAGRGSPPSARPRAMPAPKPIRCLSTTCRCLQKPKRCLPRPKRNPRRRRTTPPTTSHPAPADRCNAPRPAFRRPVRTCRRCAQARCASARCTAPATTSCVLDLRGGTRRRPTPRVPRAGRPPRRRRLRPAADDRPTAQRRQRRSLPHLERRRHAAQQCGNGARCVAAWLVRDGAASGRVSRSTVPPAPIAVERLGDGRYALDMGVPRVRAGADPAARLRREQDDYALERRGDAALRRRLDGQSARAGRGRGRRARAGRDARPRRCRAAALFPQAVNVGFAQVCRARRIRCAWSSAASARRSPAAAAPAPRWRCWRAQGRVDREVRRAVARRHAAHRLARRAAPADAWRGRRHSYSKGSGSA